MKKAIAITSTLAFTAKRNRETYNTRSSNCTDVAMQG
jgi:hypothetical protein